VTTGAKSFVQSIFRHETGVLREEKLVAGKRLSFSGTLIAKKMFTSILIEQAAQAEMTYQSQSLLSTRTDAPI
jgi:hypothetical protein